MSNSKIQKQYPDFTSEVDNLTPEQLKQRIVGMQQALSDSEAMRESDDQLQAARASAKEFAAPYNDVKKAVKLKTQYILELLKNSGK